MLHNETMFRLFLLIIVCLMCVFRLGGVYRSNYFAQQFIGQRIIVSGTVASDSKILEKESSLVLDNISYNYSTNRPESQVLAKISGVKWDFERSDHVELRGKASAGFNEYELYFWHPEVIAIDKPDPPDIALRVRKYLSGNIQTVLSDQNASALALGFLLGEKTNMPDKLNEDLRRAGLAHVVVASGFALSVLVNFAKRYLKYLSRFAMLAGASILVIAFIAITGFSPSLLRAGIATLLSLWAWYFGRRFHPVRVLAYVVIISILISPQRFLSVAWQLSYASYAGIILINPLLSKFFYGDKQPNYIASSILVSVSAQLACLPLSLYHFGTFAVCGVLSNLIVSPLIAPVMLLSFILAIGVNFPPFVFILQKMLDIQLLTIDRVSDIPWGVFAVEPRQAIWFALYILVFGVVLLLKHCTHHDFRPRYTPR